MTSEQAEEEETDYIELAFGAGEFTFSFIFFLLYLIYFYLLIADGLFEMIKNYFQTMNIKVSVETCNC